MAVTGLREARGALAAAETAARACAEPPAGPLTRREANMGTPPRHAIRPAGTVRPDGSHLRMLTHYKGGEKAALAGSYSPNGRWIVFRFSNPDRDLHRGQRRPKPHLRGEDERQA